MAPPVATRLQRTPAEQALIDEWQQRWQPIPQVTVREAASGREIGSPFEDRSLWVAQLGHALHTDDPGLLVHLTRQVASCVWKTDAEEAMSLTVAAIAGIAPRDQLESLLTVQMVAVHNIGMEFLRRTMLPDQSTEGVTEGIRRATQLLRTFTTQMEALVRYRGGGQQVITVQHVQVAGGGQAIVGNVHHSPRPTEGGGDETQK